MSIKSTAITTSTIDKSKSKPSKIPSLPRPSWEKALTSVEKSEEEDEVEVEEYIIGVDEVGRGPLAGPVTTCACWLKQGWTGDTIQEERLFERIRDSKLFPKTVSGLKERKQIGKFLTDRAEASEKSEGEPVVLFSLTSVSVERINELHNIKAALAEGWISDIRQLIDKMIERFGPHIHIRVIVDGNWIPDKLQREAESSGGTFRIQSLIHGDRLIKAISAASIIAKEWRDEYMKQLAVQYPHYGFENHAGYGTEFHTRRIKQYGLSDAHRKHFAIPDLESFERHKKTLQQKKDAKFSSESSKSSKSSKSSESSKSSKTKKKVKLTKSKKRKSTDSSTRGLDSAIDSTTTSTVGVKREISISDNDDDDEHHAVDVDVVKHQNGNHNQTTVTTTIKIKKEENSVDDDMVYLQQRVKRQRRETSHFTSMPSNVLQFKQESHSSPSQPPPLSSP